MEAQVVTQLMGKHTRQLLSVKTFNRERRHNDEVAAAGKCIHFVDVNNGKHESSATQAAATHDW